MKRWAVAVAAALAFLAVFLVQERRSAGLAAAVKQKQRLLQQFVKENPTLPAAGELDWLTQQIQERAAAYEALLGAIDPPPQGLPTSAGEQGLYVVEQLHRVTTALRRQAETAGTALPQYLGFSDDLPPPDQVRLWLRQVEMLERVVGTFVRAGASEVSLVKPLDPRPVVSGGVRHAELPLQVGVRCSPSACVKALHALQGMGPLTVVRELKVTRRSDEVVEVELVASALVVEAAAADNRSG